MGWVVGLGVAWGCIAVCVTVVVCLVIRRADRETQDRPEAREPAPLLSQDRRDRTGQAPRPPSRGVPVARRPAGDERRRWSREASPW